MSHFCRVVCSAIGRRESGVCIAFVLGIIVTTPEVHVSGILRTSRKRFSDSYICGPRPFMELDDQVDKVISSLKRKRDLKEDEASSSNGAAR